MRVAEVGNFKSTQLGEEPGNDEGNGGGHDQSRWAAEGGFAQCLECGGYVSRLCLSERLDGANIASEEGEHGYANTALERQANKGQLKQLGGCVLVVAGRPEAVVPCPAQVGYDDPEGGYTTNTLENVRHEKTWDEKAWSSAYLYPSDILAATRRHLAWTGGRL